MSYFSVNDSKIERQSQDEPTRRITATANGKKQKIGEKKALASNNYF